MKKKRLSPPVRWFGGKYYHAPQIANIINNTPHHTYVEPFGGAASVLLSKIPSPIEVWNDLDSRLVYFFSVLRYQASRDKLMNLLKFTPYSREEFEKCCLEPSVEGDLIESVRRFFILCQQSTASTGSKSKLTPGCWAKSISVSRRGMAQNVSRWWGNIDNLPRIAERLLSVLCEHSDASRILKQYDTPETLFYCDPPYLSTVRVASQVYKHEMTFENHESLLKMLRELQGKVILSSYENDLYSNNLRGWRKQIILSKARSNTSATTRSKNGIVPNREEILWMNWV